MASSHTMMWGRTSVWLVVLVALAPVPVLYLLGRKGIDSLIEADTKVRGEAAVAGFATKLADVVARVAGQRPFAVIENGRAASVDDGADSAAADPRIAAARELAGRGETAALDALESLRPLSEGNAEERMLAQWLAMRALAGLGQGDRVAASREHLAKLDRAQLGAPAAKFLAIALEANAETSARGVGDWLDELAAKPTSLAELSWPALLVAEGRDRERLSDLARRESIVGRIVAALESRATGERGLAVTSDGAFVVDGDGAVSRADLDSLLPAAGALAERAEASTRAPRQLQSRGFVCDLGEREVHVALAGSGPFGGSFGGGDAQRLLAGGIAFYVVLVAVLGFALERSRRRSEALVAARSDLIAQVTHELRTPLTVLRMYGETLATGRLDATARDEYVATMSSEAERLGVLVDRVARAARDEDPAAVDRVCDVRAITERLAAAWSAVARENGGQLVARLAANDDAAIDGEDLRLAIDVLLDNAVHYGVDARGAASVELETRCDGGNVVVTVRDLGPGIPASEREHLFERFARGEAGQRTARHGAGMGLYLARRVLRGSGGDLSLSFPRDGGTLATLVVPRVNGRSA